MKPAPPVRRVFNLPGGQPALEERQEGDVEETDAEEGLERNRTVHLIFNRIPDDEEESHRHGEFDESGNRFHRHLRLIFLFLYGRLVVLNHIFGRTYKFSAFF